MLLEAKNISFRYGKGPWILKDVNLKMSVYERVCLTGPSGYGKTTLSQILAGYIQPTLGEVLLNGEPLPMRGYCPVQLIYQHPEKALNPRWRLRDFLQEAWIPDDKILSDLGIEKAWFDRFPNELSGGEMQRFCIARVLCPQTKFLLADEISTMLDVITQAQIWNTLLEIIKEREMGLIAITHNKELSNRICTRSEDLRSLNHID